MANVDPAERLDGYCSERVYRHNDWHGHRCERRVWAERPNDGKCKQHHPETVAARDAAAHARYQAEHEERARDRADKLRGRYDYPKLAAAAEALLDSPAWQNGTKDDLYPLALELRRVLNEGRAR